MNLKNKDKYDKNKERNAERKKLLKQKQKLKKESLDPLLDKTPIESAPVESTPIESAPIESAPIESAPVESAPIESTSDESASISLISNKKIDKKTKSKLNKENNEMESNGMKEIEFKNPIFEKNVIDPTNNKIVKSIYVHSWTKLAREHWFMIWQYYRDRKRTSIQEVYDKYKDTQLRIVYKGDPTMYYVGEKRERPEPKIRNKVQKNISES